MHDIPRGWVLILVGALAGHPAAGQTPTSPPASDPVGTWVIDARSWRGRDSKDFLKTLTIRSDSTALVSVSSGNQWLPWAELNAAHPVLQPDGSPWPTPDTVVSTQKYAWGRVAGDTLLWIA